MVALECALGFDDCGCGRWAYHEERGDDHCDRCDGGGGDRFSLRCWLSLMPVVARQGHVERCATEKHSESSPMCLLDRHCLQVLRC